jgi:hypothetical protein
LMDDSILQLAKAGLITVEEAMYRAENKALMRQALEMK